MTTSSSSIFWPCTVDVFQEGQLNFSKTQIKWVIFSNLFGLLRKPELKGSVYVSGMLVW